MSEWQAFFSAGGVPVVIALVQVVKVSAPALDKRWLPLVALAVSAAWQALGVFAVGTGPGEAATYAVVAGLAAVGLYSGIRATSGN